MTDYSQTYLDYEDYYNDEEDEPRFQKLTKKVKSGAPRNTKKSMALQKKKRERKKEKETMIKQE